MDEIVSLKKEKELLDRTLINKNAQLIDNQQHLEKVESSCRSAENKHRLIESQVRSVIHCWCVCNLETGILKLLPLLLCMHGIPNLYTDKILSELTTMHHFCVMPVLSAQYTSSHIDDRVTLKSKTQD